MGLRRRRTVVGDMFLAIVIDAGAVYVIGLLLQLWG
jgi:hypothetical protein